MKITDLVPSVTLDLTEAVLGAKTKYLDALNALLKANKPLEIHPQAGEYKGQIIGDFQPNPGQQLQSLADIIKGTGTVTTDKDEQGNTTLQKIPLEFPGRYVFKSMEIQAMQKGQDGEDAGPKISNRGNVAEGVLGAATMARLIKRPGNDITIQDLQAMIAKFRHGGSEVKMTAKEVESDIADQFTLVVRLAPAHMADFLNWELLTSDEKMNGYIQQIVKFTNEANTDSYAKLFERNRKLDDVIVMSDGVTDMKGVKTDVYIEYTDENDQKILAHANISLKAGTTNQFGQVGAGNIYKDVTDANWQAMSGMFESFGAPIGDIKEKFFQYTTKDAFDEAYIEAGKEFAKQLKGHKADSEMQFMKKFIETVKYHAVRDDPKVKLLQFDVKEYYLLDFRKLDRLLSNNEIDLDVKLVYQNSKHGALPKLVFYNKNESRKRLATFMEIRAKVEEEGYWRNVINKGALLKTITKVRSNK